MFSNHETGPRGAASSADDFIADLGMAGSNHADVLRCGLGQVEYAAADEGTAIVDSHHYAPAVIGVGHLEFGAETERFVSCREK